jgi:hypothetical protein
MLVLEFCAIDLDECLGIAEERFSERFDDAGFAGSGRSEEQQVTYWTSWGIQTGKKHLVDFDDLVYSKVLSDDSAPQRCFEFGGVAAAPVGVKHRINTGSHIALLSAKNAEVEMKMKRTARAGSRVRAHVGGRLSIYGILRCEKPAKRELLIHPRAAAAPTH